ncbi:MAG: hypothetical protein E6447_00240, partial [Bradyrhizobium sp.]|nr:hypothetical protein [Bradyrhizobium sp.]
MDSMSLIGAPGDRPSCPRGATATWREVMPPYPAYMATTIVGLIRRDSVASGVDYRMHPIRG